MAEPSPSAPRRSGRKLQIRGGRQSGVALLLLLMVVVMAGAALFLGAWNGAEARRQGETLTATALREAKDAVLGWSAAHASHPGLMPCPEDTVALGSANEGQARAACTAPGPLTGRLAWRTLKQGVLQDVSGAPLWYVLSPGLRSAPINTNTVGQLSVDGVANAAVALIIAPGVPLPGQSRTLPTAANPPAAADYLDLGNAGGVAFVSQGPAATFNDRVLTITRTELMTRLVTRVLAELGGEATVGGLRRFHNDFGEFPWADSDADGIAEAGVISGTMPYKDMTFDATTFNWLLANGWFPLAAYTRADAHSALITLGGRTLKVLP
ncbi:MAG: hypothetical protein JNM32_13245 [Dechloromonas sp.]|jgi:hypothetical protein|nr:hypothetical protein [Dechloromonas sp.]